MEDKDQSKTVHNDGVALPAHDFDGLSRVVSSAKPTLPGTENGFVPLKCFDLANPYEDMAKYLDNWEKRLNESALQPDPVIRELKEAAKRLADKRESDFEQRIADLDKGYQRQLEEWREHHRDRLEQAVSWRDEWKNRLLPVEARNEALVEDRQRDLSAHYEARLQELARFHDKFEGELGQRIEELKSREQALLEKIDALETENRRCVKDRLEWLQRREEKFDVEKQMERDNFNTLRQRVAKHEHPVDDEDKSAARVLADKFTWKWPGIFAITLIAAITILIGILLCRGGNKETGKESRQPSVAANTNAGNAIAPLRGNATLVFDIQTRKED